MTIQPKPVSGNFGDQTYKIISQLEGSEDHFYLDSVEIPTIGVGFALISKSGSIFTARSVGDLNAAFSGIHTFSSAETTLLNSMASDLSAGQAASAENSFNTRGSGILDITLTPAQIRSVYNWSLTDVLTKAQNSTNYGDSACN